MGYTLSVIHYHQPHGSAQLYNMYPRTRSPLPHHIYLLSSQLLSTFNSQHILPPLPPAPRRSPPARLGASLLDRAYHPAAPGPRPPLLAPTHPHRALPLTARPNCTAHHFDFADGVAELAGPGRSLTAQLRNRSHGLINSYPGLDLDDAIPVVYVRHATCSAWPSTGPAVS